MSEIGDGLVDAYTTYLTTELIDNVLESDPSRATLVRGGSLQADPVQTELYVLIHIGDPRDDGWNTSRPTWGDLADLDGDVADFAAMEIGGGMASTIAMTA